MHGLVPLSYLGTGGTSIFALSNKIAPIVVVVARQQTGNVALRRFPCQWRSRNPERPAPRTGSCILDADDERPGSDVDSEFADSSCSDDASGSDDGGLDPPLAVPHATGSTGSTAARRGRDSARQPPGPSASRRSQLELPRYVPPADARVQRTRNAVNVIVATSTPLIISSLSAPQDHCLI